jgi:biotin-dependent carboxylase-like uncharacterized protein
MSALVAVEPGPMVTVQDGGRYGHLGEGIPESGPMDAEALWMANTLVGNSPTEGALEFGLFGGHFTVTGACRVAVAGGDFLIVKNDRRQPAEEAFDLVAGDTLALRPAADANFGYLAVAGGFALKPFLGSVATHVRYALGPIPRPLRAGDELPLRNQANAQGPRLRATVRRPPAQARAIRIVLGPQNDHFAAQALEHLFFGEYRVTAKADRMGFRLSGPPLPHLAGADIISDGIAAGSIQVPADCQPIILLADRQTTGGLPKIATVVTADLHRVAQRRTGSIVRFIALTPRDAELSYVRHRHHVAHRLALIAPVGARD